MHRQKSQKSLADDIGSASPASSSDKRHGNGGQPIKMVIITNHPPPFRIPIYERIGKTRGIDLHVIFCSRREPNREWELPPLSFKHSFLRERFVTRGHNFIHNNLDVLPALKKLAPDVVVTTGFNPTYLYAFSYAMLKGVAHVPMTDGTDASEEALGRVHRLVRKIVFARSHAFISASNGGQRLYERYGIPAENCFKSCLCIDNDVYQNNDGPHPKQHDFIFCGRIVDSKNPLFALEVARRTALKLGRKVRILFVGSGAEEAMVREEAERHSDLVEASFNGFASQEALPALYRSARIFLFPTQYDAWGVVANEACAAGLPVIVSPYAGVSNELVVHGENGFVCELDADEWSERALQMLSSPLLYERFARRSRALVAGYTFDHAAEGLIAACRHALSTGKPKSRLRAISTIGLG